MKERGFTLFPTAAVVDKNIATGLPAFYHLIAGCNNSECSRLSARLTLTSYISLVLPSMLLIISPQHIKNIFNILN